MFQLKLAAFFKQKICVVAYMHPCYKLNCTADSTVLTPSKYPILALHA